MSPRENTGGDQVARLRFCTPWSRQLATGDGATRTRASSRCYQLLPPWYHPYKILLLLSPACCVVWCMVREGLISSSIAALPRASWWNTAVVHARPFLVPGPRGTRAREETATKTEWRAFGGYLLHAVQFGRGGYQCALLLCCVSVH